MSKNNSDLLTLEELELLVKTRKRIASGEAKNIRLAVGLSEADIARACGVTASGVNRWEHGHRYPRADDALRYGRVLDLLDSLAP